MSTYFEIIAGEKIVYEVDFTDALPAGASSIVSATVVAKKIAVDGTLGLAYDDLFLSTTCSVASSKPRFTIDSAVASERYRVELSATTNDGQIIKTRIFFRVLDA